jgi:hypothetical protein
VGAAGLFRGGSVGNATGTKCVSAVNAVAETVAVPLNLPLCRQPASRRGTSDGSSNQTREDS